jgi:hypothetical protein
MSCTQAAASSRSASAPRTGARLRARLATPWTCAQRRGKGSWRSARACCCAHDASVFTRPRLGGRSGTFHGRYGPSEGRLGQHDVPSSGSRYVRRPVPGLAAVAGMEPPGRSPDRVWYHSLSQGDEIRGAAMTGPEHYLRHEAQCYIARAASRDERRYLWT